MATNLTITGLRFARLRAVHGFIGHGLAMPVFQQRLLCVDVRIAPITGLAQGRIVSISRGSPPPKLR